jgi:hypothetical protein
MHDVVKAVRVHVRHGNGHPAVGVSRVARAAIGFGETDLRREYSRTAKQEPRIKMYLFFSCVYDVWYPDKCWLTIPP